MKRATMRAQSKILAVRNVYQGKVLGLRVDRVVEPGGIRAVREVVTHGGSVVVLPVFGDGRALLIRQFRHAAGGSLWELVAGSIEPGESVLSAARRELLEETGYKARKLTRLLEFFSSPGFLTEKMYLVEATGLARSAAQPEPDECIRPRLFTRSEIRRMLRGGKIRDAKTLVGLLWLTTRERAA